MGARKEKLRKRLGEKTERKKQRLMQTEGQRTHTGQRRKSRTETKEGRKDKGNRTERNEERKQDEQQQRRPSTCLSFRTSEISRPTRPRAIRLPDIAVNEEVRQRPNVCVSLYCVYGCQGGAVAKNEERERER